MKNKTPILLLIASFPILLIYMDYAAISIIFPEIVDSYKDVPLSDLSWILNGNVIFGAALAVPFGRLSDKVGRKKVYIWGLIVLSAGCVMNIASFSYIMVIVARILQGIGSAMIVPASISIILSSFEKSEQSKYFGVFTATGTLAAAVGPIFYSLISHLINWRFAFVLPLVLALICLFLAVKFLDEYVGNKDQVSPDVFDVALIIIATGLLALFIVKINSWGFSIKLFSVLIAAIVLLAFFLYNCKRKSNPVIDLNLFKIRSVAIGNLVAFVIGLFYNVSLLASIYFLKDVWGYNQWQIGIGLMIISLAASVASIVAGRVGKNFDHRIILSLGLVIYAFLCAFRILTFDIPENYWLIWVPAQIIGGFGVGMMLTSLFAYSSMELPKTDYSTGSAINSAMRQVGAVFGSAISILAIDIAKGSTLPLKVLFFSVVVSCLLSAFTIAATSKGKMINNLEH